MKTFIEPEMTFKGHSSTSAMSTFNRLAPVAVLGRGRGVSAPSLFVQLPPVFFSIDWLAHSFCQRPEKYATLIFRQKQLTRP